MKSPNPSLTGKLRRPSARRLFVAATLGFLALPGLSLLGVLAWATSARADGIIYVREVTWVRPPLPPNMPPLPPNMPPPPPRRIHFPLEVTRHRVLVEIDETAARTRVEESFYNPNDGQLEGVYLFPLPPEAAVSAFAMKVGGREVTGEILEKGRAREIYEQIVRQVRDPGLLEYVDRGLFRASVFPIPPRGAVEVSLEYSEALARERGTAVYRYPLDTGKYSAGDYKDVVVDIKLRSSQALRSIHCPSHEAALISRTSEREARVSFEAKVLKADKDFLVTWNVSEDALAPTLMTYRGPEPEGFFFLSIFPRPEKSKVVPPKDVVFVIDTSGSMLGTKLDQVKKALKYCLSGLNAGDRFSIVDFSTEARRFRDGLTDVSEENRKAAMAYVAEFKARGGTNIEEALRFGLADASSRERLALMVLLTDGEPTIGAVGPGDILRTVKEKNTERRRIFVFGVGDDLNAKLLDSLAKETRGITQYLRSQENIEVPLSNFFDKIDTPVFTDLELSCPGGGISDFYPRPLPDLFRGEQLDLFGRFTGDGHKTIALRGKFQGEERVFEYSLPFTAGPSSFIPRLWATRKIGYLLEQMRLAGETAEVKDEVIRLSKRYGVITPYTSYLILEEDRLTMAPGAAPAATAPQLGFRAAARDALAKGVDRGSEGETRLRRDAEEARAGFGKSTGGGAVDQSVELQRLKAGAAGRVVGKYLDEKVNVGVERVQQVDERTFYLQGTRWVDSALEMGKIAASTDVRHVKYLSDEYFKLLSDEPGIGKLLSVGTEVVFLWKGNTISIDP